MLNRHAREQFLAQGYLVVPDVIPQELCDAVINCITSFAGIDPADSTTWYQKRFSGLGIVPSPHPQALWDVRQHPALHEIFSAIYQTSALWVSMDRAGYKPPASSATQHWQRAAIHWDCDPWRFDGLGVQGLIYLTDTAEDQGAFSCVPSIYRNVDAWCTAHADDPERRHPVVGEEELIPVPAKAGSLILFHRLMPHTNRINASSQPRFVQYVTMQPIGGEAEREQRVREWRENMPPAWALAQKIEWQEIPEPGEPARLSELGRKLVGIDRWE